MEGGGLDYTRATGSVYPSPCGRGWRRRRRVRGSCHKSRIIDRPPSGSAISLSRCGASQPTRKPQCGDCCEIGASCSSNFVAKSRSRTTFLTLFASGSGSLSKLTEASTHRRRLMSPETRRWLKKASGLRDIGTTTFCNDVRQSWKTFLQSSARGERPLTRRASRATLSHKGRGGPSKPKLLAHQFTPKPPRRSTRPKCLSVRAGGSRLRRTPPIAGHRSPRR
jgi:hypothetical protein